jgi:beta-lactamase regulating signal transducer with metallopeptidase domain
MRISSQVLLTFLLNACWQIPLITLLAVLAARLLKTEVARYSHGLWVAALLLSFFVPTFTSSSVLVDAIAEMTAKQRIEAPNLESPVTVETTVPTGTTGFALQRSGPAAIQLDLYLATALILLYCAFVLYRVSKLAQAIHTTRVIRRAAQSIEPSRQIAAVIARCEEAIGSRRVEVRSSSSVSVPVTVGLMKPLIILPDDLLREGNTDLLMSAIGHEFIHVARRDYFLNFLYELIYLPLCFHPAAAVLRRRIKQTRELCCDELVAERVLDRETYARSLVRLASDTPALRRLSVTTTVGIADADILEVRIMSLLRKRKLNARWKKVLLTVVSLLLVIPCVAAASFAMRFEVNSTAQNQAQEPSQQEKEAKEKAILEERRRQEQVEFKKRLADDPKLRAEFEERARKQELELKARNLNQATLARLARITMEQAIQIATSQQPGKVLESSLVGEHWEAPGKLAADGKVLYHIVIIAGEEPNLTVTHTLVNAIDGTILKEETEKPRRRNPEPQ